MIAELEDAQRAGAIGPAPISDQVAHARGFLTTIAALSSGSRLLDLGSGGGLPGLVLADARPDLLVTLLDGRRERALRLEQSLERLGRLDVAVVAARAEEVAHGDLRGTFDAVVARSFGSPAVTAECAVGFLKPSGVLVVSEPPDAPVDRRWPVGPLLELGLARERYLESPFHYVVLRVVAPVPGRLPRRVGIPAKRPLFTSG